MNENPGLAVCSLPIHFGGSEVFLVRKVCTIAATGSIFGVILARAVLVDVGDAQRDRFARKGRISHLRHPQVGDLDPHSNKFAISGFAGLMLVVLHAELGSLTASASTRGH